MLDIAAYHMAVQPDGEFDFITRLADSDPMALLVIVLIILGFAAILLIRLMTRITDANSKRDDRIGKLADKVQGQSEDLEALTIQAGNTNTTLLEWARAIDVLRTDLRDALEANTGATRELVMVLTHVAPEIKKYVDKKTTGDHKVVYSESIEDKEG